MVPCNPGELTDLTSAESLRCSIRDVQDEFAQFGQVFFQPVLGCGNQEGVRSQSLLVFDWGCNASGAFDCLTAADRITFGANVVELFSKCLDVNELS